MEYVEGTTLRELMVNWGSFQRNSEYYYSRVESALRLLLSFPVPQDATSGPCGGGLIRHPLFKDYLAPIQYGSVDELEGHLNTVSSSLPVGSSGYLFRKQVANFRNPSSSSAVKLPTVKLERELHFVFSELYEGNVIFTTTGEVCVIDFEQANSLPLSFMTHAMVQERMVCLELEA